MMVLLEGVFKQSDGKTVVDQPHRQNVAVVEDALALLVGHHVQFAMHHVPALPFDPTLRGLGACHVEGQCPLGHDDGKFDLYNVTASGVLRQDPWRVEQFDGTEEPVRLDCMVGHMGRLACASVTELEKLREAAASLSAQVQAFRIGVGAPDGDL